MYIMSIFREVKLKLCFNWLINAMIWNSATCLSLKIIDLRYVRIFPNSRGMNYVQAHLFNVYFSLNLNLHSL